MAWNKRTFYSLPQELRQKQIVMLRWHNTKLVFAKLEDQVEHRILDERKSNPDNGDALKQTWAIECLISSRIVQQKRLSPTRVLGSKTLYHFSCSKT